MDTALRLARRAPSGRLALARLAQFVDPLWLWSPLREQLQPELDRALRDACVELPQKVVERTLRDAWGAKPTEELDDLDRAPAAVTPIAQVHRGVLDGAPVAVKVLRPGVASGVRADLVLLDTLTAPLRSALPRVDSRRLFAEVRDRTMAELDLEAESDMQRRVHRLLGEHPAFLVPAPVTRLAHPSVMVSPWVEGTPLGAVEDRDSAAALLAQFVIGGARAGIVHGAPGLDDVLVCEDGRMAVLDWGSAQAVAPDRVAVASEALTAVQSADAAGLGSALARIDALPAAAGPAALELTLHALGELAGAAPSRLDVAAIAAARVRLAECGQDLWELATEWSPAASDLWALGGVAQAFATVARLGAEGRWLALAEDSLARGWDAAR